MKDNTELETTPKNCFFIEKPSEFTLGIGLEFNYEYKKFLKFNGIIETNKIDSTDFVEFNKKHFQIYWMSDNRKLIIEKELYSVTPDSGSGFWLVINNKEKIRKIYDSDIKEIRVLKTNWGATSLLIVCGILLVVFFAGAPYAPW